MEEKGVENLEKAYEYLKREFKEKNYFQITVYLLNEIEEHRDSNTLPLLEYIKKRDVQLYNEIFSTIFSYDRYSFEHCTDIVPYLDLETIIPYMERKILESEGDERIYLVSLHDFYSQVLYGIVLLREFKPHEIIALEPVVFMARILPHHDKINIIKIILNHRMYNHNVDKNFVLSTIIFSKEHAMGHTEIPEYLLSDNRPKEFLEVFEKVNKILLKELENSDESIDKNVLFVSFFPLFFWYEMTYDYETLSKIMDMLFPYYHDIQSFKESYVRFKFMNNEFEDVVRFIKGEIPDDKLINDNNMLYYYGISLVWTGEVDEGVKCLEMAYEKSEHHPYFLIGVLGGYFYKGIDKVVEGLKTHIQNNYPPPTPEQFMLLFQDYVEKYPEVAEILIKYFQDVYMPEGINPNDGYHYHFLLFKAQYHLYRKDYETYVKTLEEIINYFPDKPGGYGKLMEFYSSKRKGHLDISKALKYAEKLVEIEGLPREYYEGIIYTSAGEYEKAIKALEKFVSENRIISDLIYAYKDLSINYFNLGDNEKGCEWGEKFFERYNTPQKRLLYMGSQIESKKEMQRDYEFLLILSKACWKLKDKIRPLLDKIEREADTAKYIMTIQKQKESIDNLKKQIEILQNEIKSIKSRYSDLFGLEPEELERFFNEISDRNMALTKVYRKLNEKIWNDTKKNIVKIYPNSDNLPDEVRELLISAEFLLEVGNEEMDFSGPVIQYAKAIELLLDIKISREFVNKNSSQITELMKKSKNEKYERNIINLFPNEDNNWTTLSLTVWGGIINTYVLKSRAHSSQVIELFVEELKNRFNDEDFKTLKNKCYELGNIRNDYAHKRNVKKSDLEKDGTIEKVREAIKDIIAIVN